MFGFIKKIFSKEEKIVDLPPTTPPIRPEDLNPPLPDKEINIDTISYIEIEKLFLINSTDTLSQKNKRLLEEYRRWGNRRTNQSEVIREESKKKLDLLLRLFTYYKTLE